MKLRVDIISSFGRGPNRGKRIDFVELDEDNPHRRGMKFSRPEEVGPGISVMVSEMIESGIAQTHHSAPKIMLRLKESEYDELGIRFEVNEVYEVALTQGGIKFVKSKEGV